MKDLAEELSYSSSDSIYVVTWDNALKQVFTPFKTVVLTNIGLLLKGEIVSVDQVKVTLQLKIVFIVEGRAYYHFHFGFIID
ncbi:hypothetical protein [uncultured Polaribacter sp.]|uniref:hypothetical protein n=1 Tax=uncultured Polaribacter sp. TaxID=174711 RepID=UPI002621884A|nr:hypothetical protein [uncultured Polaribacter sp.]